MQEVWILIQAHWPGMGFSYHRTELENKLQCILVYVRVCLKSVIRKMGVGRSNLPARTVKPSRLMNLPNPFYLHKVGASTTQMSRPLDGGLSEGVGDDYKKNMALRRVEGAPFKIFLKAKFQKTWRSLALRRRPAKPICRRLIHPRAKQNNRAMRK